MTLDAATKLRLLARDHHDGRLDLATYRSLRAALLDSLTLSASAGGAMENTQPRAIVAAAGDVPMIKRTALADTVPGARATAASDEQRATQSPAQRRTARVLMGAAAFALIAAGLAWWWLDRSTPARDPSQIVQTDTLRSSVTPFVDSGDWSDEHVAALNATLLELGRERLAGAAREPWFLHFVDELRHRLKEQQALATAPLTADNSPLAALALTVGLDLNSPDASIRIAALPEPTRAAPEPEAERRANEGAATRPASSDDRGHAIANASAPKTERASASNGTAEIAARVATVVRTSNGVAPPTEARTDANARETANESACRAELIRSRRPLCHDMVSATVQAPLLALVPSGTFEMGSTADASEQPIHRVTIAKPFAISVYEISQGEFREFCEQTRRTCAAQPWSGDDYPVVNVSWEEARAYAEWLSGITRHHYGLPTEAQWEYAARAGQSGLLPHGDTLSPTDAHYSMLTKQTEAVRRTQRFNANAFRLVHVLGNVREWVEDDWVPSFADAPSDGASRASRDALRVVRGGSYADGAARLRLSMREGVALSTRDATTGFRIVRELP